MEERKLLTTEEVAKMLNTKPSHIRNMKHKKKIPYLKIGGFVRYDLEAIQNWLKENTIQPK